MSATLQLVLGDLTLDLNDSDVTGLDVDTVDLGYPIVREVLTALPGQDGEFDETQNFRSHVVSLTGTASNQGSIGSRQKALDAFAPFLAPKARPSLIYAFDDDVVARELQLRVAQWSGPISSPGSTKFQMQWKATDPIAQGLVTNEVDVPPAAGSSEGRIYPLTFDRVYPVDFGGSGEAFLTTNGNYEAWPIIRFFGPVIDPGLFWLDPTTSDELGIQVVTSGITVLTGDYLEVDTKARTMVLNGDADANRYNFIDFTQTMWGALPPGEVQLRFTCISASAPAEAQIFWRDAYL